MHVGSLVRAALCSVPVWLGATRASAYQVIGSERVDYTAYTLERHELSLGLFKAEIGLTSEVMVGTYVPTWFAFPWVDTTIPTGYLKLRDPFHGRLALSGRVTIVYLDADELAADLTEKESTDASLILLPIEVAASFRYNPSFTQSLEFSYVAAGAGATDDSDVTIRGAGALGTLTVSTLLELRMTRVFAVTLLARALLNQSPAHVRVQFTEGSTSVNANLGFRARDDGLVACAVPGVAFSWSHVNVELGVGYGSWWLPVVQLPLVGPGVVFEGDVYVRF